MRGIRNAYRKASPAASSTQNATSQAMISPTITLRSPRSPSPRLPAGAAGRVVGAEETGVSESRSPGPSPGCRRPAPGPCWMGAWPGTLRRPHRDDWYIAVCGLLGGVLLWALGIHPAWPPTT